MEGRLQPPHTSAYVSIRQNTSAYVVDVDGGLGLAYVSIRQHTSAYVSIRQNTSAYDSIRAANVSIHQHTCSKRQHT